MKPLACGQSLNEASAVRRADRNRAQADAGIAVQRLPFAISVVHSEDALLKAVSIRHSAYARHVPAFADKLRAPEPHDFENNSMILLAESRLDGTPVGTIRVQSNRYRCLGVEHSVELPARLRGRPMAEATRLGVAEGGAGRVVKAALIKALYLHCLEAGIEWVIAGARPGLDRQYESLLMEDLFPGQFIALHHSNDIPHRIMALDVMGARAKWGAARHPLFDFMCRTKHPDIDLSNANATPWDPSGRTAQAPDAWRTRPLSDRPLRVGG